MDIHEFSDQFDVMLNTFGEGMYIALDEYEKSVFLTQAQQKVVETLYNGNAGYSFEESEGLRRCLSSLVKTVEILDTVPQPLIKPISKNSYFFMLPDDLWFITYEKVTIKADNECMNGKELDVMPVAQDEYLKTARNPFRGANNRRALRLDVEKNIVEIVSKYEVDKYLVRYVRKLHPIILTNLPDGLTIQGESIITECELHPSLHDVILNEAVRIALKTKSLGANATQPS